MEILVQIHLLVDFQSIPCKAHIEETRILKVPNNIDWAFENFLQLRKPCRFKPSSQRYRHKAKSGRDTWRMQDQQITLGIANWNQTHPGGVRGRPIKDHAMSTSR